MYTQGFMPIINNIIDSGKQKIILIYLYKWTDMFVIIDVHYIKTNHHKLYIATYYTT
jgi:hypothetical protein